MVGNISSFESMVYREVGRCLRLGKSDMQFDFLGRDLNLSWVQRRIANADKFGFSELWVLRSFNHCDRSACDPGQSFRNEGRMAPAFLHTPWCTEIEMARSQCGL